MQTGTGRATVVFTIANTGSSPLTGLSQAFIDGPGAASFLISAAPTATVLGGQTSTLSITFSPRAFGLQTATLHLLSNDPDENPLEISLTGTGGLPITTWRQQYFGDTTNTGDAADTDWYLPVTGC